MSIETYNSNLYAPRMTIDIEGPEHLREVEMEIASQVDPWMTPAEREELRWHLEERPPLNEFRVGDRLVRAPQLRLEVMAWAYDVATNPAKHGWELSQRRPYKKDSTGRLGEYTVGIVLGFEQDDSTHQKAAWYIPNPTNFRAYRNRHIPRDGAAALTVKRYISKTRSISC